MADRPTIRHPLLEDLRRADKEAARQFPSDFDPGLGGVGLIMKPELGYREYDWCTPVNCWCFAHTGGDGVHFSLLAREEAIWEDSPVVMTTPAYGGLSWVVGECLFDFLCFGSPRGYFALEQLAYEPEVTLQAYTDPMWQPTEKWHDSSGLAVDEHTRRLLDFLTERFHLRPWTEVSRFHDLQERYANLLQLPPEMGG